MSTKARVRSHVLLTKGLSLNASPNGWFCAAHKKRAGGSDSTPITDFIKSPWTPAFVLASLLVWNPTHQVSCEQQPFGKNMRSYSARHAPYEMTRCGVHRARERDCSTLQHLPATLPNACKTNGQTSFMNGFWPVAARYFRPWLPQNP